MPTFMSKVDQKHVRLRLQTLTQQVGAAEAELLPLVEQRLAAE